MSRGVNRSASVVILAALALGAMVALGPGRARACSCVRPSFEDARSSAAAIFEGRVESIEPDDGAVRVRMHVTQAWVGVERETVELETARESAACGYEFVVGEHYLVYAGRAEAGLAVSLCSRTARMDDANDDRQLLGSGTIPVDVEDDSDEPASREPPAPRAGCASCRAAHRRSAGAWMIALTLAVAIARRSRRGRDGLR